MKGFNYQNDLAASFCDKHHQLEDSRYLFYINELKGKKGRILDIGCGTGVIFLELLKNPSDIYGFDISLQMIEILRNKAKKQNLILSDRITVQNMINFFYPFLFDVICIPSRSFLHLLNYNDQIMCLNNIYTHLKDNGEFILDITLPNFIYNHTPTDSDGWIYVGKEKSIHNGYEIELWYKKFIDELNQIEHLIWKYQFPDLAFEIVEFKLKYFYMDEFKNLLINADFEIVNIYGDFDKSEYTDSSKEMIFRVKKRKV